MLFTCIVAVIHMPDMPDLKLSKQLDDIIKGDIKMGDTLFRPFLCFYNCIIIDFRIPGFLIAPSLF